MKKLIRFAALCCVAVSCLAEDIFVKIDGIPGGVTLKGFEDTIAVLALSHEVISPRDAASGQATGKRQHTPIRLVFEQEVSTPRLFEASSKNTVIPNVVISFLKTAQTGVAQTYFKYELKNVSVSSIRPWKPSKLDSATATYPTQVEVAFVYQTIVWTYTNGGVTHEDSWNQQR